MKLIKDKELLQNIAHQINLLNTVGGGVSETYVDVHKYKKGAVIEVWAATVNPESFRVVLHNNQLMILSALHSEENPQMAVPLFNRTFQLPPQVDLGQVEAIYQDGQLQVKLPYYESADHPREIEIKQL
ncbi:Hsp20/alpha crystallin family protein [Pontibacter sp. 172403-2]|uniref:Hsp20/alpha crystallin family protein n=1 Tax=Pontibacter rufus TaxID=2791028 RepID=UPI0018AFE35D|nr:Hsp20/alpha crystallin family protein [Pontibacter sp. 172403-2]MBF9253017.1 Hsp20/alpha crystallin family protein [Pontibacter sp. 172403-2]